VSNVVQKSRNSKALNDLRAIKVDPLAVGVRASGNGDSHVRDGAPEQCIESLADQVHHSDRVHEPRVRRVAQKCGGAKLLDIPSPK